MTTTSTIRSAWIATVPILASYILLGFGFGVALQAQGHHWIWAMISSITIYAGAMQYAMIDIISQQLSVVATIILALAVNGRHVFYAVAKLSSFSSLGPLKYVAAFQLTDEVFAVLSTPSGQIEDRPNRKTFAMAITFFCHSYWIIGSTLGALAGPILPFDVAGIEFSMTALFVVAFLEQMSNRATRPMALSGIVISLVCLLVFGYERFLIPTMIAIVIASLLMRSKWEEQPATSAEKVEC